jgi:hypothetical protein
LEARAVFEEAQWRGIITWMDESEQKWDSRQENNERWGVGIMNMIA